MNLGMLVNGEATLRTKLIWNNLIGSFGLSAAAFTESISFHESALFKAAIALVGLTLGVVTIYSIYLDVKLKQRKLEDDSNE